MKHAIYNGGYVGTAEWRRPGEVELDFVDPQQEDWFEHYFANTDAFLSGPVDCPEMTFERRDSSAEAFTRALYRLAEHEYTVRPAPTAASAGGDAG